MASWIGHRLANPLPYSSGGEEVLLPSQRWPTAAWGRNRVSYRVPVSTWPVQEPYEDLSGFLDEPRLLSARATAGFLRRTKMGNLRFPPGFIDDIETHLERMGGFPEAAA